MTTWRPASRDEVESIVSDQLRACTQAHRQLFEQIRIPAVRQPIERSGRTEFVFAVGRLGDSLLFWGDVEEGFEVAAPDEDGVLRNFGASQFELSHIMFQLQNGQS